jgi:hypothetical protein
VPDAMDGEGRWYDSFRARLTAKTGTSPILYTWEEQQLDRDTGEWLTADGAREGTAATEINNNDIDVTGEPLVRIEFKGINSDGEQEYEFEWNGSSGGGGGSSSYPKVIAANAQVSTGTASPVFTISGSGLPKTVGNVVVAMVVGASGTGAASGPSGWTGLKSGSVGSVAFNQYYWCGYRVLDGSEPTNFTFSLSSSGDAWLIAFEITGASAPNTSTGTTDSSTSPKFATTAAGAGSAITDDSVLIALLFADGGTLATESPAPSSYPDAIYHGTATHMIRPWARHRAVASQGYFGDCYLTLGSSSRWVTVVAAIPPA